MIILFIIWFIYSICKKRFPYRTQTESPKFSYRKNNNETRVRGTGYSVYTHNDCRCPEP